MSKREELQSKLKWLDDCDDARNDIDYIFDITGTYTDGVPALRKLSDGRVRNWTKAEKKNFKELDKLRRKTKKEELDSLLKFINQFYMFPYIPQTSYSYDRNGFVYLRVST